jgi:hypothetical protein
VREGGRRKYGCMQAIEEKAKTDGVKGVVKRGL